MNDSIASFKTLLDRYQSLILPSLLNPHNISVNHFVHTILSEVKRNESLLNAYKENPKSLFASILTGAEVGLIPSDMIGEFYLIPRHIKQQDGRTKLTVTPMIGYKGLVSILLRSGDITKIHTEVVYKGDKFTPVYGLEPTIIHKPNFKVDRISDNITHAYAVAKTKQGEYQFVVVSRKEIEAVRDMSAYPNDLYFNDKKNPNRWMEKKVALVQLSKMLPKDYYSKKAIGMDALIESGSYITIDDNNQVNIIENTQKKPTRYRNIYGTLNTIVEEIKESN
jgi:recombination protein RecT